MSGHRWKAGSALVSRCSRQSCAQSNVEHSQEHWPDCWAELKVIAVVLEAPVVASILHHLGLPARWLHRSLGFAPQDRRIGAD